MRNLSEFKLIVFLLCLLILTEVLINTVNANSKLLNNKNIKKEILILKQKQKKIELEIKQLEYNISVYKKLLKEK